MLVKHIEVLRAFLHHRAIANLRWSDGSFTDDVPTADLLVVRPAPVRALEALVRQVTGIPNGVATHSRNDLRLEGNHPQH